MRRLEAWLQHRVTASRTDIVGLDVGFREIKAVRMRRGGEGFTVTAADLVARPRAGDGRLSLPGPLVAKYAAVCVGSERSAIRLLDVPVSAERSPEEEIQQQFHLEGDYRMGHHPLTPASGRGFMRTVAIAVEEAAVQEVLGWLATGAPAVQSVELSGLAALNAYLHHGRKPAPEEAVALIEAGARCSYLFMLHRDRPALIRKFDVGALTLIREIEKQFGLDAATAEGAWTSSAIDLGPLVRETLGDFLRQLVISRDFVERQESCRVQQVWLTGGLALNSFWRRAVEEAMRRPVAIWDPFEGLTVSPDAVPTHVRAQACRFAAAVGAACGALEGMKR